MGRIIFLTREKTSFAILIACIIFSRVKTIVRPSDWLELFIIIIIIIFILLALP